ncbi:MAG: Gfo/Idh/MocA family protein [Pseudomonadota bacterium]
MDEPEARITTIAARDPDRARHFAAFAGIPSVLDSYEAVISSDQVDAVYIPLPITAHHQWTIAALNAGKHVLCEKSFAANADEAAEMASVAEAQGKVLMDAFHYRYHPIFLRAREIVTSGMLGDLREIDACFHVPGNGIGPDDIRKRYDQGGGVTMDIGCYPISWIRHITGQEPRIESARVEVGPPNVDLMLAADWSFPGGVIAHTSGDMRDNQPFRAELTVRGHQGTLVVRNPLVPQNGHLIELTLGGKTEYETRDRRPSYGYQLDAFLAAVNEGVPPLTGPTDAIRQMQAIDSCYDAVGLPRRGLAQSG